MSSLGDLLLGNVSEPPKSPPPPPQSDIKHSKSASCNDGNGSNSPPINNNQRVKGSPKSGDVFSDTSQPASQKVFPSRIEKNTVAEDCQSNASSVDDYVAELLDPNDRPRNVWHVVEGPKESPGRNDRDGDHIKRESDVDMMKKRTRQQSDDEDEDSYGPPPPRDNDREHRQTRGMDRMSPNADIKVVKEAQQDNNEINLIYTPNKRIKDEEEDKPKYFDDPVKSIPIARDDDLPPKSPALSKDRQVDDVLDKESSKRRGSRERSSSSRRHRHDRDRDRDRDSHRDRDRDRRSDRDRRRSPDRYSKSSSSRRRRDYSDDEDEDRRKRHRGSGGGRSRRHSGRRSRSGSRSTSLSRRRDRSRTRSQSPATQRNSRTILIMQLSPRVEERDLENHFSDIGRVREVRLILDSKTRRHKGIAYIEFDDAASATKALTQNGQMFHGAPMQIQSALVERARGSEWHTTTTSSSSHHYHPTSNHNTSSSTTTHTSSRPPLPPNSYRVYMGGLHVGITEEMLRTIVEPFGMIHKVEVIKDRTTGFSRGYAFVTFASIEDGQEAVRNLDGFELAGKNMRVSKSTEKIGHQ